MTPTSTEPQFPPEFFRRADESDDRLFYAEPRLVVHVDEPALRAISQFFKTALPAEGLVLDLMSSWRSHLPDGFPKRRAIGLGLNATELAENPQLAGRVVHDVNANPVLPFHDGAFDAAAITVSIQYLVAPVEVFREVNRVLKAGAPFYVIYSNRMFPTKAVAVWQALDDTQRAQLIASYFMNSGGWSTPEPRDLSPRTGHPSDPVYVVSARKAPPADAS
ncbi:MAG: methyltransferase domain-containing protein [Dehalococcoidia bacterium]|nr:methyltransferase domain-containing protein [Dehalococcoidia bacterium]